MQFEYVYFASLVVGLIAAYLTADMNAAQMANSGVAFSAAAVITMSWVFAAIGLVLALLTSRKASNVARWIVIVFAALGIVTFPFSVSTLPLIGAVSILAVSQFVLSVVIIYLLFRPDARAWFADGRG